MIILPPSVVLASHLRFWLRNAQGRTKPGSKLANYITIEVFQGLLDLGDRILMFIM